MLLDEVIGGVDVADVRGPLGVPVTRVDHDSRQVGPGSLFCCVPGARVDGHRFAAAAAEAGAAALLVERFVDVSGPTQVRVRDVRRAMAPAAAAAAGHPSRDLTVIGVTGTNGKTTTTFLLDAVFGAAGRSVAVLGTLSGPRTTPEAPDLQRWLAAQRDAGVRVVAMEVSSHALALHRVDATRFAAAVFTNLTRDHLDFHGSMEDYYLAKRRLFSAAMAGRAVVNVDDPYGRRLHRELRDTTGNGSDAVGPAVPVVPYSLDDVGELQLGAAGSTFTWRSRTVRLSLGGRFNVANALAAAETAVALGVDEDTVAAGLSAPLAVPGRFEAIDEGQPFRVVVDYAHTPDGLEQVLRAAREVAAGRVHVVFGCGGDRDATKRPVMGRVAASLADRVVLTADNSRHEDTRAIISAVQTGIDQTPGAVTTAITVEPDRDAAIGLTLGGAAPGDVVVIAGKGHESTQTEGDRVVPFDDRDVARRHLRALAGGTAGGRTDERLGERTDERMDERGGAA